MSQRSDGRSPSLEEVSALVDGELDESAVGRACAAWRDDADTREAWHTWHLIGDVLRSDDLAAPAARDSQFMASLRARLAEEPVVLAPSVTPAAAPQPVRMPQPAVANGAAVWRNWRTPAAVAAGFAVVASVLVTTRVPAPQAPGTLPAGTLLAQDPRGPGMTLAGDSGAVQGAAAASGGSVQAAVRSSSATHDVQVLDGRLIRDARIDEYLAAHKKFGGSSGPGGPSGSLRNAAAVEGR